MAKHAKRMIYSSKPKIKIRIQEILLIIFICTFFISGYILLNWYINTEKSNITYEQLGKQVISQEEKVENSDNVEKENIIDFEQLNNINSDVVAWINIDGTNINYPVVKTTDNNYYLNKNFYKENDICGSIFLDYRSNITDKNIVMFGHNIKRGYMFSDLEKIAKGEMGNNINITVYTQEKIMSFDVFSSYIIEPEDIAIDTRINEENLSEFKQNMKKRSQKNFEGEYLNSNQILTLSTCDRSGKNRVLVHAGLNKIDYI